MVHPLLSAFAASKPACPEPGVNACVERTTTLSHRAGRIALRLFAEKPKAFRHRLEALWEHGRNGG